VGILLWATARREARPELLDGMRAVAALFVVLTHGYSFSGVEGLPATAWLRHGRFAVDVFIVLSGFCLTLGAAREVARGRPFAFLPYLRRRALRILPPYYAAVGLTLVLIACVPDLATPSGRRWDIALPATSPGVLLSHLLLVHNLDPAWVFKINGALWSVATEWQIYFLFPVLLRVWHHAGMAAMVSLACAGGAALHCAFGRSLDPAAPWYIGLFAMGMAAAALGLSEAEEHRRVREGVPWMAAAVVAAALVPAARAWDAGWATRQMAADTLAGAGTAAFLIWWCRDRRLGPPEPPAVVRVLSSRPLVGIGTFSYSLYLVHVPVIAVLDLWMHALPLGAAARLGAYMAASLAASLGVAYPFHLLFERPFMRLRRPLSSPARGRPPR